MSPAYLASLRNETLAAFHHAACRGVEDATAADRAAAVDFASELSLTFRREILRRTQAAADAGDETGFQALRAACTEEYAMIEDTISGDAWIGTAEQIAEVQQFARDFNWEDRIGTIDAEGAADDAIGKIDCAYEDTDDGEGEIHPDARARLRAALIDSAERENARRAAKADPSWGPGDPAYDAIPEPFPGVEGGAFMRGVRWQP